MAIKATFSPTTGLLSEFGDDGDNVIVTSRDAAGQILVNGGAVPVCGGAAPSWSCPHPLRRACCNQSTRHLAPAAERSALLTHTRLVIGRPNLGLSPLPSPAAIGAMALYRLRKISRKISREIQDGPELGFKPVMTSAAKRPATCCGTPFKPVHS